MDMLGGSPEVSLLPDLHILHRDGAVSKRLLIVRRSKPQRTGSNILRLERRRANGDTFARSGAPAPAGPNGVGPTGSRVSGARAQSVRLRISGGDDRRGRTRVAAATGALATGASRSRRRDLRLAALARLRPAAGATAQEAQASAARPHLPYSGAANARHHRVSANGST